MSGVVGGLLSATRRLVDMVKVFDEKQDAESNPIRAPPNMQAVEGEFIEAIEWHIAKPTNFLQAPAPKSILKWVLANFPEALRDMESGYLVNIPIQIVNGQVQENLDSVGPVHSVIVSHLEIKIATLNKAGRVKAIVGNMNTDLGVMLRMGPNGLEPSRPLITTSGELLDRYLVGRTWSRDLVDEFNEEGEESEMEYWHRDLRSLMILIDCAHISTGEQRWSIYRCIIDHTGTHYLIQKDLSKILLEWQRVKYAPINLNTELSLSTEDPALCLKGFLMVVYFSPVPRVLESTCVDVGNI